MSQLSASVRKSPSLVHGILGVLRYELARTATPFRIILWLALTAFPVLLVGTTLYLVNIRDPENDYVILAGLLYVLLPEVVTVLCMLLWAAPIVNDELESQTWIYIIVRPGGRRSLLLGRYIVAVAWTATCTTCSTVMAITAAHFLGIERAVEAGWVIGVLNILSAVVHGALFLLIGCLFQRRAMVYAFVYAVVVEAAMGWVPAVVNRFTISYRLRSLLLDWLNIDLNQLARAELSFMWEEAAAAHVSILLIAVPVLLLVAIWRVEHTTYRWQSEV